MNFSDIYGQKEIIESLKGYINKNNPAHAYLFEGAVGVGKKTLAKMFAKGLMCESGDNKPCGKCKACMLMDSGSHPDFKIISGESSISVETIRDLVKDVGIMPYYNGKKIYVIEDTEKMTIQAQNSLLKTLEEPPEYVIIILTVQSSNMLLPTIISRCIIKKFPKNTTGEVENYIKNKYPKMAASSSLIASLSDGIIGNAIKVVESEDFNKVREDVFNVILKLFGKNKLEALETAKFFTENKDNIDFILHIMISLLRDMLILKETNDENLLTNKDYLSKLIGVCRSKESEKISDCINAVLEAKNNLSYNSNFSLTTEVMILKING